MKLRNKVRAITHTLLVLLLVLAPRVATVPRRSAPLVSEVKKGWWQGGHTRH